MSIRLYHFTSRHVVDRLVAEGFAGATCWLSPTVQTVMGEESRSGLIEVELDLSASDLEPYSRDVSEEIWDDDAEDFVPANDVPPYSWYEVPTHLIARFGRLRVVSLEERSRLFSGEAGA